jgi:hypothetical protein
VQICFGVLGAFQIVFPRKYDEEHDDEESSDDEDVLSRQAIKMHAQQIIDSKNKKHKPRKNKRKTKQNKASLYEDIIYCTVALHYKL